jgi:hypothetical protein
MCGEPLPYGRATAAKQQASPKHHHHDSSKSSSNGGHANKNIWIDTHDDDSYSDERAHHHVKQKRYV